MKHIVDGKADIVNLNNEELYLAGRLYNLEPFAMEQYNGGKCYIFNSLGLHPATSLEYLSLSRLRRKSLQY